MFKSKSNDMQMKISPRVSFSFLRRLKLHLTTWGLVAFPLWFVTVRPSFTGLRSVALYFAIPVLIYIGFSLSFALFEHIFLKVIWAMRSKPVNSGK
jgi:hypothetical protein